MASLGNIGLSLLSGEQQTTLSAANFNFDFTLVKVAAPKEYEGLGQCLSVKRKTEAEEGPLHIVARKLGALFAGEAPTVPNLISAYGKRASQISQDPKVNPTSSRIYSMFADHVGADGTSLWAAATSGKSTITVHLLGCMIARIWKAAEAVSIWTELVAGRKAQLLQRLEKDEFQMSDAASARIEITRDQLAAWDNSARSWLRTADSACERWQRQLLLIADNVEKHLATSSSVYTAITKTWRDAMQLLDNLVAGIPQSIQNMEVLLGLSSWHLYPDMSVVHNKAKHVYQKDDLVAPGGIMTIGLQTPPQEGAQGILWSLPLSHLRYYGRPVASKRELSICTSRITFEQFLFLSLGSLTKGWKGGPEEVVELLFALSHVWRKSDTVMPTWMRLFFESAQWYESLAENERDQAKQIFYFGQRRCENLFGAPAPKVPNGFGLCNVSGFVKALPGAESRVTWLRNFMGSSGVVKKKPRRAIIRYHPDRERVICPERQPSLALMTNASYLDNEEEEAPELVQDPGRELPRCGFPHHTHHPDTRFAPVDVEFASVYPFSREQAPLSHQRWIPANESSRIPCGAEGHFDRKDGDCCWQLIGYDSPGTASVLRAKILSEKTKENCGLYHSGTSSLNFQDIHAAASEYESSLLAPALMPIPARTLEYIQSIGPFLENPEVCLACGNAFSLKDYPHFPPHKRRKVSYAAGCSSKWYIPWIQSFNCRNQLPAWSVYVAFGDVHTAALCLPTVREARDTGSQQEWLPQTLEIDYVISQLKQGAFSSESLSRHLTNPQEFWKIPGSSLEDSFAALLGVAEVYKNLPDSTIDIEVTSTPLKDAKWQQKSSFSATKLARDFSCIARFESGGIDVDPVELTDVIAISSGNSLHIAACCLRDPSENQNSGRVVHTIGNVGKPGMSFLISPKAPLIREPERNKWQLVRHAPFDGKLESNLTETTLHLSFTGYEFPLRTSDHGAFDKEASFVEAAVRAFERSEWVADVDLVGAFRRSKQLSMRLGLCNHSEEEQQKYQDLNLTSVDCWTELLDAPMTGFVVRAKGDWLSRLAVFAVSMQTERPLVIASEHVCWSCAKSMGEKLRARTWARDRPPLMVLC